MQPTSRLPGSLLRKVRDQRWRLARWRLRAEREALALAGRQRGPPGGRVLSYHSTGTPEWGVNDVAPGRFTEQLDLAARLGYRFVPADDVAGGRCGPKDLAVTFDDGLRSILAVTPYLESRGIPFTVFVVADWASEPAERFLSWPDLERLAASGAAIGSHSMTHANFRQLPREARCGELEGSRKVIARHLGAAPTLFAIPYGRTRDWDAECTALARAAGYAGVFAQSERTRPPGTIGRSFVCSYDRLRQFRAVLEGRFDRWEEWF